MWWWLTFASLVKTPPGDEQQQQQPYDGMPCSGGYCRPSFLIIGVGKCGTSSLYYYLTGHPSVIPASQKQIQWFDHQYSSHFDKYLHHFPRHMEPGQMTGEASPGYAQYSEVPGRVFRHLPQTRILVIVRDPAERAYSAYHYNYLNVASKEALSFDFLIEKEKILLESCAKPGVDLSRDCYGKTTAVDTYGHLGRGMLPASNQHLWRQLLGRSLYFLYLYWWPRGFHAVCSELLGDLSTAEAEMDRVAAFLGLSLDFDFGPVVGLGKYNAGTKHQGYQHITPWDDQAGDHRPEMSSNARRMIDEFTHPYNLKLFEKAGRTCPGWSLSLPADVLASPVARHDHHDEEGLL